MSTTYNPQSFLGNDPSAASSPASASGNPGRVAGLWYLLLVFLGPPRLMYIPGKLFVDGNASATVNNIAAHAWLFRFGMVSELLSALVLIFLVLALHRVFKQVDPYLAVQVILFGGVMPALLNFVNVVSDAGALTVAQGADFLSWASGPQRDALVMLLLRLHHFQDTAAELLWGVWLFPLALLVYRSRFLPRFLGVWVFINGIAYVALSLSGFLFPQVQARLFLLAQPALFGELVLVLWLLIKGAKASAIAALWPHG